MGNNTEQKGVWIVKKLYEVEISGHIYVMAENANEAERFAKYNLDRDDLSCDGMDPDDDGVWAGWEKAEPYNSDDNRKVGEILETMRKERKQLQFEASCPTLPFGSPLTV